MANPSHVGPYTKGEPAVHGRHQRRSDAKKRLDDAYADVDIRDAGYCWVTGHYTLPKAADARRRREHHHLKGRNVRPEWVFRPERIITVTAEVHQYITSGWLHVEGCDARKAIFFHWDPVYVKPGREPFRLKGKRAEPEID